MTTFNIKRGGIWQNGKLCTADNADPTLRTVELSSAERELIDPKHTDLQSSEEAGLEAKTLEVDAALAKKRAVALAKIDAEHTAELKATSEKKLDADKKGGGK